MKAVHLPPFIHRTATLDDGEFEPAHVRHWHLIISPTVPDRTVIDATAQPSRSPIV